MTFDAQPTPFLVTLGFYDDGSLNLRFPPELAEEVLPLLDENEIDHGTILELSADVDLWIEAVRVLATPAGLTALAAEIHTVVRRHKGKRFVLKRGEFEIQAEGYSAKAVEKFLEQQAAEQAAVDSRWHKMLKDDFPENGD